MAPSTERSASRLLGKGLSRVASAGINVSLLCSLSIRLRFVYFRHTFHLCASARCFASAEFLQLAWELVLTSRLERVCALCAERKRVSIGVACENFGNVEKILARMISRRKKRSIHRAGILRPC